jgi:hypothetical protein
LELIGIGNDFLNRTPLAEQLRERMDKWDFMKLKSFCTTKEMVTRLKRKLTRMGENLCQLYIRQGIDNQNTQGAHHPPQKKSMS